MTFTNEEIKIIKNHIKEIENYCKTEILPQITDEIWVDFSEIQYRKNGSSFKKTYYFHIDKKGIPTFTSSALRVVLDKNHENDSTSVNAYDNWRYTIELLERWQTVKIKLQNKIHEEKAKKTALLNFKI